MIDRRRGETDPDMNIELLMGRGLIRSPEMQQIPRPATLGKVARVLDESIRRFRELPVQQEGRLSSQIAPIPWLGWPVQRELPAGGPIIRKLSRPGQLQ